MLAIFFFGLFLGSTEYVSEHVTPVFQLIISIVGLGLTVYILKVDRDFFTANVKCGFCGDVQERGKMTPIDNELFCKDCAELVAMHAIQNARR